MRARGIDISKWQQEFIYQDNLDFIIIKATEGWGVDPWFEENLPEVMKVPVRGAYHYYRTETDPIIQAENFLAYADKGDFHFLAVDYEAKNNVLDWDGANNLRTCLAYLVDNQDLPVLIYTSPYLYRDNLRCHFKVFDLFPLWLARYCNKDEETGDPTTDMSGDDLNRDWDFWQYEVVDEGELYGVCSEAIDKDVFNGTVEELTNLFGDITKPVVDIPKTLDDLLGRVNNLITLVNTHSVGIAELYKRLDNLQQGQLELAENGLGYEQKFRNIDAEAIFWNLNIDNHNELVDEVKAMDEVVQANAVDIEKNKLELNDCVDSGAFMSVVDKLGNRITGIEQTEKDRDVILHERIDGLKGGHNHPKWMRWLGLVK